MFAQTIFHPTPRSQISFRVFPITGFTSAHCCIPYGCCTVRCAATKSGGEDKKSPARLAEVQRLLYQAEERYEAAGGGVEPIPKITLDRLSERVRERIMQMEKNRINKDGEIVISSTKTRAQKGNTEDALAKLQVFTYQKKKLQPTGNHRCCFIRPSTTYRRDRLKSSPSCLQSRSRNDWATRKHNRRRKQLEEVKIAGTDQMKHK